MTAESPFPPPAPTGSRLPSYYGWVIVCVAALAMTATLPGRTHGLGLITEPLLDDLQIERTLLADINFVTCLIGAAFCIPFGQLLDRYGTRINLAGVVIGLGFAVLGMARVSGPWGLFAALVVIRALGQSALSVVSLAAVGKWFRSRLPMAMGLYTLLMTFGFIGSVLGMGAAVKGYGWRAAWEGMGWILLVVVAPIGWFLQRDSPESLGQALDPPSEVEAQAAVGDAGFTLGQALSSPTFWVFALGTSAFNLVWSAVTLFNESVLVERGFDPKSADHIMAILTATGLVTNLIAGAVCRRERLGWLLGIGMAVLSVTMAALPSASRPWHLWTYAASIGLTGGVVMVVFFAAWGSLFGRSHLGKIQGAAQLISVVASAAGPVLLAQSQARFGAYGPTFYGLAIFIGLLSVAAFVVPLPRLPASFADRPAMPSDVELAQPLTQET